MIPHRSSRVVAVSLGLCLFLSSCGGGGVTRIDLTGEPSRLTLRGSGDETNPSISFPKGVLDIQLTDNESIEFFGWNNYVRFAFADEINPETGRILYTDEIDLISAQSSGHTAAEVLGELQRRVELAGQTADWDQVREFIESRDNANRGFSKSVVETTVGDGAWNLSVSLLSQNPDDFTIRFNLWPNTQEP